MRKKNFYFLLSVLTQRFVGNSFGSGPKLAEQKKKKTFKRLNAIVAVAVVVTAAIATIGVVVAGTLTTATLGSNCSSTSPVSFVQVN